MAKQREAYPGEEGVTEQGEAYPGEERMMEQREAYPGEEGVMERAREEGVMERMREKGLEENDQSPSSDWQSRASLENKEPYPMHHRLFMHVVHVQYILFSFLLTRCTH